MSPLRRRLLLLLLMLVVMFGQLVLVVGQDDSSSSSSSSPDDNRTIHIGYLLESMDRAGAINVAIARAQTDRLLPGYNFR